MPHETLLHREQTALVVVDVQEKLLPAVHDPDTVLRNVRQYVRADIA
jgi:nicotinamidase-related amidase